MSEWQIYCSFVDILKIRLIEVAVLIISTGRLAQIDKYGHFCL